MTTKNPKEPSVPPTRGYDPPSGFHWEWEVAHSGWRVDSSGTRRCRYVVDGHRTCKQPAVVTLNRGRSGQSLLYGYCANPDHLYGRTVHDGQVWDVVMRPDREPSASAGSSSNDAQEG